MTNLEQSETWGNARRFRRRRVWFIPLIWIVLAFFTALGIPRLDAFFALRLASISPDSEIAILSSIASGMMALTAIVFSLSFVFVQFGSTAYSPRVVGFFIADPVVLHAIGIFSGTFLFALLALSAIDRFQSGDVPYITTILALGWLMGSILMFLLLVQRITLLQINNVLALIGNRGRLAIEQLYPPLDSPQAAKMRETAENVSAFREDTLPAPAQVVRYHGGPRVIAELDVAGLVNLAKRFNALFILDYAIGDVVTNDSDVLNVYQVARRVPENSLRNLIVLANDQTIEQDPKYALRLLVDIAIKALSAAINDPTTAVMAMNQIDDLLRQLDVGYVRDDAGALRFIYPTPQWEDFLSLAIDEIRFYGASSLQVMRRLGALLEDLEEIVPPERRAAVRAHAERAEASIVRSFTDVHDRLEAQQVDRQGLGLARPPDDDLETQEPLEKEGTSAQK